MQNTLDGHRVPGWPQLLSAVTLVLLLLPGPARAQPIHLPLSPAPTSAPWDLQRTLAFTHINATDHGLSSNLVERIVQDDAGFMWFSTLNGLNRYDGSEIVVYRNEPADPTSLSGNVIRSKYLDRGGRLWLATVGGGINSFAPTNASLTSYRFDPADPQSLSGDFLDALAVDRQGMIWGGARGSGLNRLDPATGQVTRFQHDLQNPASLSSDFVFDVYVDRSGEVWIGTFGGGLDRFDPATGNFVHYGLAGDQLWRACVSARSGSAVSAAG